MVIIEKIKSLLSNKKGQMMGGGSGFIWGVVGIFIAVGVGVYILSTLGSSFTADSIAKNTTDALAMAFYDNRGLFTLILVLGAIAIALGYLYMGGRGKQ